MELVDQLATSRNSTGSVSKKELSSDRYFFHFISYLLGEGTYGVVYRAKDTRSGEIVALKKMRTDREQDGIPVSGLR